MRCEISQYNIWCFVNNSKPSHRNLSVFLAGFISLPISGIYNYYFCPEDTPKAIHGGQRTITKSRTEQSF